MHNDSLSDEASIGVDIRADILAYSFTAQPHLVGFTPAEKKYPGVLNLC
jgi:hypothetical protein